MKYFEENIWIKSENTFCKENLMTLTFMIYALNFEKICCSVSGIIYREKIKYIICIFYSQEPLEQKRNPRKKRYLREIVG